MKHSLGVWEESDLFSSHQGKARERNPHKKFSLSFLGMNYVFPIVGDSFCFVFSSKEFFFFFCLRKMTKSNACVFCMGLFFLLFWAS